MIKKKGILLILAVIIVFGTVSGSNKIDISVKDTLAPGEKLDLEIKLLNSNNFPINGEVLLRIEDQEKSVKVEKTVLANQILEVDIGENAPYGNWNVFATYTDPGTGETIETNRIFFIEPNQIARFSLEGDVVTVTNVGNTRYTQNIIIFIGEEARTKLVDLDIGESLDFRLIAPEGKYNVRITDGKTSINEADVSLTGNVIGILDQRIAGGSSLASGINGKEDTSLIKNGTFVFVFVLGVIGAAVLLIIERNYRKKLYEE